MAVTPISLVAKSQKISEKQEEELTQSMDHLYFLSSITYNEAGTSDVEVLRVGVIQDRKLSITMPMLKDFVENFKQGVYGTEIQVNLEHNRGSEAAGWVKDLYINGLSLIAKVDWTELGKEKISKNLFKFVSAELAPKFPHFMTGKTVSNVFIGLALTNTPALKGQQPISLSEVEEQITNNKRMFNKIVTNLMEREFVSKDDKALVKQLFDELPAEEQEAVKADAEAIEAKPEEAAADPEALEEKISLSEFNKLQEKTAQLQEKLERTELGEVVDGLMFSEGKSAGIVGEKNKTKTVEFMLSLNPSQRTQFLAVAKSFGHVDLSVKGAKAKPDGEPDGDEEEGDDEDKIVKNADKLLKGGKAKDIEEAQKMARKQLAEKEEGKKYDEDMEEEKETK